MTNYFLGLAERTLGLRESLQPSIASMFEPGMLLMDDYVPAEAMESEAMTVESSPMIEPQYDQTTIAQSPTSNIDAQFFFRATQPQLNEASFNVPSEIEQGEARSFFDSITARASERLDPVQRSEFRSLHLLPNSTSDWTLGTTEQSILKGLKTDDGSRSRSSLARSSFRSEVTESKQEPGKVREGWQIRSGSSHQSFANFTGESQISAKWEAGLDEQWEAGLDEQSVPLQSGDFTYKSEIPNQWNSSPDRQSTPLHTNSSSLEQAVRTNPICSTFDKQSYSDADLIHQEIDRGNLASIDSGLELLEPDIAQQQINYSAPLFPLSRDIVLQTQNDRQSIFGSLPSPNFPIAGTRSFRNNKSSQTYRTVPMFGVAERSRHDGATTDSTQQPILASAQQQIGSTIGNSEVASIVADSSTMFNSLLTQPRLESELPIQRSLGGTEVRAFSLVEPQSHTEEFATILPRAEIESRARLNSLRESSALTLALSPREKKQETSGSLLPGGEGLGMRATRIHTRDLLVKSSHSVNTGAELKVHAIGVSPLKELQPILSPFNELALINSKADRIAAKSSKVRSNNTAFPQENYSSHSNSHAVPLVNSDRFAPTSDPEWNRAMSETSNNPISHRYHTAVLHPDANQNIVPSIDEGVSNTTNSWAVPQDSQRLPTIQKQLSFHSDPIEPPQTLHQSNRATLPLVQHQFRASEGSGHELIQELASYASSSLSSNSQTVEPGVTVNASVLNRQDSRYTDVNQPDSQLESRTVQGRETLSNASIPIEQINRSNSSDERLRNPRPNSGNLPISILGISDPTIIHRDKETSPAQFRSAVGNAESQSLKHTVSSLIRATAPGNQTKEDIERSPSNEEAWGEITSDTGQTMIEPIPLSHRFAAQQSSPVLVKENFAIAQSDTTQAHQPETYQLDQSVPSNSQVQPLVQSHQFSRDRTVLTDQEAEFLDRIRHQRPNAPLSLEESEADFSQNRKKPVFSDPAPRPPIPRTIAYFRPSLKLDDYLTRRQGGRS